MSEFIDYDGGRERRSLLVCLFVPLLFWLLAGMLQYQPGLLDILGRPDWLKNLGAHYAQMINGSLYGVTEALAKPSAFLQGQFEALPEGPAKLFGSFSLPFVGFVLVSLIVFLLSYIIRVRACWWVMWLCVAALFLTVVPSLHSMTFYRDPALSAGILQLYGLAIMHVLVVAALVSLIGMVFLRRYFRGEPLDTI